MKKFKRNGILHTNFFFKLIKFIMCLPGTNAPTKRLFSVMNNIWSAERTQLNISTLKAILIVKTNSELNCVDFYDNLSQNVSILNKICSSEKYNHVSTSL